MDLGSLQKLLDDPAVSEIMINGPQKIFVERGGKKVLSDVTFSSEEELLGVLKKVYEKSGKRLGDDILYSDTCLDDGTRINVILFPLSRFGISATLRKFSKAITGLEDLIKLGTLSQKAADFLIACTKGRINILFSGGTGVGKTTLLQGLSHYFGTGERVITIEDAAELKIPQENLVSLETKSADRDGKGEVTLRDLIRNALRMTPDRIIMGEVRGPEAIDMIQAMATGHSGTLGVVHGNSPKDVIARLETMIMMAGLDLPLSEIRKMIVSTINLIVHVERLQDGNRKVTYITEIRGIEQEEVFLNDLFVFDKLKIDENGHVIGELKPCIRYFPTFFPKFQKMGLLSEKAFETK
ncbi:MAG: ATPase, T2SS/T4P/T4SS family [Candidatus Omnitrophota bacterium]|nr:Flp pilus assembly complex ATPase component TadA [Candidatus Omnitrophota bacterium]